MSRYQIDRSLESSLTPVRNFELINLSSI